MELQTIRTRLSFLLHYNRCIKFENSEMFGNGKLTFHCHFFPSNSTVEAAGAFVISHCSLAGQTEMAIFKTGLSFLKFNQKREKSGINMGAGGVEIAILKLGHSSSNRVLPPLVEMSWQRSFHSKLKEKTYKSAAPPSQPAYF